MIPEMPDIPEQDWVIKENDFEWSVTTEDIDWESDPYMEPRRESKATLSTRINWRVGRTSSSGSQRGISNLNTPIYLLTPSSSLTGRRQCTIAY